MRMFPMASDEELRATGVLNADGTFNGPKALALLTGLQETEISWTFRRLKELMVTEGRTSAEALAIVKEEGRTRPWEAVKPPDSPPG